jgi:ATP-dependent helicase/nuclease subunit A
MGTDGQKSDSAKPAGRGNLIFEANSGKPSLVEMERMARRRFQAPKPKREGKWWYIRPWRDDFVEGKLVRRRVRMKVAPAEKPLREVQKIAAEMLRATNQGLETLGSATNFAHYVENTYKPIVLPLMAATTRKRYEGVICNYLVPAFGSLCLRDLTPLRVQAYFSGLASSKLSQESRDKLRDVLSSILGSAVRYQLLIKNPVEGIMLPPDKRGKKPKPFVTPEQFEQLANLIPEPYATMVYVAVWTGLRVSELIGLRWEDVHAESLTIDERCTRGDWGAPKSDCSNATICVSPRVIERIHRLKGITVVVQAGRAKRHFQVVKSSGPNDLVFQSVWRGVAMRDNNVLSRYIKPAARQLEIGWVNWRCLRTSHATWMIEAGANPKDVQGQMRHSRISTTMEIYAQFVSESARRAIGKLSEMVDARNAKALTAQQSLLRRIN